MKRDVLAEQRIDLMAGVTAVALDVEGRAVTLADGRRLVGDAVVLATGATPRWLPGTEGAPGSTSSGPRRQASRCAASSHPGTCRVVVIGGGLHRRRGRLDGGALGLRRDILEALEVPLSPIVGDEVGAWLTELHAPPGVDVRAGVGDRDRRAGGPATGAGASCSATGERLEADVVVVGIGVRPRRGGWRARGSSSTTGW